MDGSLHANNVHAGVTILKSTGARVPMGSGTGVLARAKAAAVSGDTIDVGPGTYNERDLFKNGVNWHFRPGAVINYTGSADGGIFDNSPTGTTGAITCRITGYGRFIHTGSNTAGNSMNVVTVNNTASDIRIWCDQIIDNSACLTGENSGVRHHGGTLHIHANEITSNASGVWWSDGELYVDCNLLSGGAIGGGAIYSSPGTTNGVAISSAVYTSGFLWVHAKKITAADNCGIQGAGTNSARVWVFANEISATGTNPNGGNIYVLGNLVYVVADKVSATSAACIWVSDGFGTGPGQLWATVQKLSVSGGGTRAIHYDTGGGSGTSSWLSIGQIEDPTNSATSLITCVAGTHKLRVQSGIGGTGANGITVTGGTLDFTGAIDTSAKSTSSAVTISGGTATLRSAKLTSGASGLDLSRSGGTLSIDAGVVYSPSKTSGTLTPLALYGTTPTAFGLSLLDDADAAAGRTTLAAAPLASPTFTGTVTVLNVNVSPSSGTNNSTINFGANFNVEALILYDGGAGGRYGWGLRAGEMQFWLPNGQHYSWNKGGDFQASGTNELMRLDATTNALKLANTGSVPGTPTGGGVIYVESGALKFKGSSGTVTTLGNA
jgi:hypothetical protein